MRTFIILSLLATTITTLYAAPFTREQELRLDNIAWLHAQFSLTFDSSHLPLDEFYWTFEGHQHFEQYQEVEDFFDDRALKHHFLGLEETEWTLELQHRIEQHQASIVIEDNLPMTFKAFYTLFKAITKTDKQSTLDTFDRIHIYKSVWDSMTSEQKTQFCRDDTENNIKDVLSKYQIYEPFPNNAKLDKLENKEKRPAGFVKDIYRGDKEPKPDKWTVHHIIPSLTLTTFFTRYFNMLVDKSKLMEQKKRFDWVKIADINAQKALMVKANKLWSIKPVATFPVNEGRQHDFVRAFYRFPPGLVFYGPGESIRIGDPRSKLEKDSKHITGTFYFERVHELYNELERFNGDEKPDPKEAMRLYNRIMTINKEYGLPIYMFPFNTDQWILSGSKWQINTNFNADKLVYSTKLERWLDMSETGSDVSTVEEYIIKGDWLDARGEWSLKQYAQADYLRKLQAYSLARYGSPLGLNFEFSVNPLLGLPILGGHAQGGGEVGEASAHCLRQCDELRRKRRHHTLIEQIEYQCEATERTIKPTPKMKGDGSLRIPPKAGCDYRYYLKTGAPSILAVPYWGWCKLFG